MTLIYYHIVGCLDEMNVEICRYPLRSVVGRVTDDAGRMT